MNSKSRNANEKKLLGRCKVCTKRIYEGEDHLRVYHAGNYYLVCCASCGSKFEASPQQYLVN